MRPLHVGSAAVPLPMQGNAFASHAAGYVRLRVAALGVCAT